MDILQEDITELKNFKKWNEYSRGYFESSFDRVVYQAGGVLREDNFYSRYLGMFY